MKIYLSISILFTLVFNINGQDIFAPNNYDFACYAKVTPSKYKTIFVYNGEDSEIETQEQTIKIYNGEPKWVKKKADRNCLSTNPEDCLVWCLIEASELKTFTTLLDTSSTDQWESYRYKSLSNDAKVKAAVLCKSEISRALLSALSDRLFSLGYDISPEKEYKKLKGKINKEFKTFQEDHDLAIGQWTIETMDYLHKTRKSIK